MEIMNGYVVVADNQVGERRVILAARSDVEFSKSGFEYVTAETYPKVDHPTSWYWGHYFEDLAEAHEDFQARVGEKVG